MFVKCESLNCFDYRFIVIYDDAPALHTNAGNDAADDEEEIKLK